MSSAYIIKYIFIKPMSIPAKPFVASYVSRSFKYVANKKGERHSPCLTHICEENGSPGQPLCFTLDLTLLYMDFIISNILPRTPNLISLNHNMSLTTKSKALVKSIKAQYSCTLLFKLRVIRLLSIKEGLDGDISISD